MSAPDLSSYYAVHLALRAGAHALSDVACTVEPGDRRRVAALARYWHGYATEVLLHHTIEDDVMFPALVERVAVAGPLVDRGGVDHEHLDVVMARCTAAVEQLASGSLPADLAPAFAELAAHMAEHLDFEDADVLPLFERHFGADEYAELDHQAVKRLGIGTQAAFTVPFIVHWQPEQARAELMRDAPLALRAIHRATRRRHARLVRLLFGQAAGGGGPVQLSLAAS